MADGRAEQLRALGLSPLSREQREGQQISGFEPEVITPLEDIGEIGRQTTIGSEEETRGLKEERVRKKEIKELGRAEAFSGAIEDIRNLDTTEKRLRALNALPRDQAAAAFNALPEADKRQLQKIRTRREGEEGTFIQPRGRAGQAQAFAGRGIGGFVQPRRGRAVKVTPFRPETLEAQQAGLTEEATGRQAVLEAQELGADALASFLTKTSKNIEQTQNEAKALEAQRSKMAQDDRNRMQATIDSIGAGTIDPGRFWRDSSTGSKISMILSLAFGGFAAGFGGGENQALKMLTNAIDNDIDAQIQTRETKIEKLMGQRGLYSTMLQHFGDQRQAEAATRLAGFEIIDMQLQAIAASTKSQELKAQGQIVSGQLQQAKAASQAAFESATRTKIVGGGLTPEEKARNATAEVFLKEQAKAAGKAAGEGAVRGGPAPKGAAQLGDKLGALFNMRTAIQQYKKAIDRADATIAGAGISQTDVGRAFFRGLEVVGLPGEAIESANDLRQAETGAVLRMQAAIVKGIPSDRDTQLIKDTIKGAGTLRAKRKAVADTEELIESDLRALRAGASQEALEFVEGRIAEQVAQAPEGQSPDFDFGPPVR